MSFSGSVEQFRRGILASLAFVVVPLLLLAAACGTGMEPASPKSSESAALLSSSKHGDAGTQYSFVLFDVPGAMRTVVNSLNDLGSAAGDYWDVDGGPHAFVRGPSGTITTFAPKGAVSTAVGAINDFGIVVGTLTDGNGRQHGFVRKPNGNITQFNLPNPPAVDTNLSKLNNSGALLGVYDTGNLLSGIPFLVRDGQVTFPGEAPGSAPMQTYAIGLNDFDVVSGTFVDLSGNNHGFLLNGTHYTTVDYPGSSNTAIWTVNDRGQVVVDADDGCGFIFDVDNNTFDPLPCVGLASYVYDLNNRGQFSGLVFDSADPNNVWHGLIATPVRSDE
jgi:hypothetical protein